MRPSRPLGPTPHAPPPGRLAAFALVAGGLAVVLVLLWPFLPGLVLAAVMATLGQPLHVRLGRRVKHPGVAAGLATLALVLVLVVPLIAIATLVGTQAVRGVQMVQEMAPQLGQGSGGLVGGVAGGVAGRVSALLARFGVEAQQITPLITTQVERLGSALAARTLGVLSGLGGWMLQVGVAVVTLFYMFRDGPQVVSAVRAAIPLERARVDAMLDRARDVTQAIVFGNVLVAIVQGTIGGVAFMLIGLPAPALWGTIMGFLALIPMVGPPLIWVPTTAYLFLAGEVGRALVLLGIGALVIGTVDNLLRAAFVGGRTGVHSLVVFLSVLGGLFVFGAVGIVAGPVLFVIAMLAVQVGRLTLQPAERRPPVESVREAAPPPV